MRHLTRLIQLLFAATFLFSGLVKCIDPVGTAIKLTEYLQYFGLGFLSDWAMGMAWVLCLVEFLCGFNLLLGHLRIVTLIISSLMMVVFTPLTLWLYVSGAIEDCGCFGDAVRLTNGETFAKNVVLDAMLVWLWVRRRDIYQLLTHTSHTLYSYWIFALMVWLCWLGTWREPLIDFRPYVPGTDLRALTVGEERTDDAADAPDAEGAVTYTCIYRLGNVTREFPLDSLPDEAEGWEFVETVEHRPDAADTSSDQTSTSEGEDIDFFVRDVDGNIVTRDLLTYPGYTLLLLSSSLDRASQHDIDRIEQLSEYCIDQDYPFYCLTARDTIQYNHWLQNTGAEYPFLFTDATIVQTICRSNPGVMLLRDGEICWKRPLSILDASALTSAKLSEQSSGEIEEIDPQRRIFFHLILIFAPFPLFLLLEIPKKYRKTIIKKDSKDA